MQINTRFGAQEVDPASIINFPLGLAGFEHLHEFKLFHEEGKPTVFFLQSVQDPDVQFPVVNPDAYQVSYECVLSDDEAATLQLDDPADIAVLVTLAQGGDRDHGVHANFMGPILLNTGKRVGLQKHLNQVSGSVVIRAE
ncbi:MAG: flagellar assembly protein FliW [Gammaproteobacteria bacterium]|nr:flagellar assembly protein FliW [Gammaproteobacteria bacterium]MCB1922459.1 flagellar assembly protein FliW [Gammaproteobacteria bacterium]